MWAPCLVYILIFLTKSKKNYERRFQPTALSFSTWSCSRLIHEVFKVDVEITQKKSLQWRRSLHPWNVEGKEAFLKNTMEDMKWCWQSHKNYEEIKHGEIDILPLPLLYSHPKRYKKVSKEILSMNILALYFTEIMLWSRLLIGPKKSMPRRRFDLLRI